MNYTRIAYSRYHIAAKRFCLLLSYLLFSLSGMPRNMTLSVYNSSISHQIKDSTVSKILSFSDRLFRKIDDRINNFDKQITRRTDKALSHIIKQEQRMKGLMAKSDSLVSHNLFTRGIDSLKHMQSSITSKGTKLANPKSLSGDYFPYLDTLKISLSFLKNTESLSSTFPSTHAALTDAFARVKAIETKLKYSEKIQSYLRDRQLELRQQLEHLSGYAKARQELDKIKKEMYYYNQQLSTYKDQLSDPARIEEETLILLRGLPAFNKFMEDNGALASIFGPKDATNLKGLQTREMVTKLMKGQMGLLGPEGDKIMDEYFKEAQKEMDKFKQQAEGQGDMAIPGFKPNGQKTKSLWDRIEIGTDCQFNKNNSLLPSTGDFGISIAYHVTKNGVIGIGGSWKMGMGKDIMHISLTHEGIGMRSFLEYAIIKGFNIRGGYERNFLLKKVNTENLIFMKKPENWQQSALIGISKKMAIPLKLPVLKKKSATGSVQLLYDFLYESHFPATPALQLRVGMGL